MELKSIFTFLTAVASWALTDSVKSITFSLLDKSWQLDTFYFEDRRRKEKSMVSEYTGEGDL